MPKSERAYCLRPMRSTDIADVVAIETRAFGGDAWPASAFHQELDENRLARYFVLKPDRGEAACGYIGLWALPDEVHIVTVAVDPAQQRRGLGELLVQRAAELAREVGADRVTLECRESNVPALRLYHKYGLQQVGRRKQYYADNHEDALILTVDGVSSRDYGERLAVLRDRHRRRTRLLVRDQTAEAPAS